MVSQQPRSRFPLLLSYAYVREYKPEQVEKWFTDPRVDVLLDCGAFSTKNAEKEISLEKYMAFVSRWGDHLFGYLSLDVLGDPKGTDDNLRTMLDAGLKPIPVHVLGDGQKRMDELFEMSDFVALGGLRRPNRGHCPRSYVKQKMEWAAGRRVHWLGYTREPLLRGFRPYSCDSSNFTGAERYGNVRVYLGKGRWWNTQRTDAKKKDLPLDVAKILLRLGYSADDWRNDDLWRRNAERDNKSMRFLTQQIVIDSFMRWVIELEEHCGVRAFQAATMIQKQPDYIWKGLDDFYQNWSKP